MGRSLTLLVICVALAACAGKPTPTPSRTLGAGEHWLPVANWGDDMLCAGGGYPDEPRLHGAPDDPRLVWMIRSDGTRTELGRPLGFSARFAPTLQVLDDHGRVIASERSIVQGGCGTADPGVAYPDFTTPEPLARLRRLDPEPPAEVGDSGHLHPGLRAERRLLVAARQPPPHAEAGEGVLDLVERGAAA
jgi:hypothetical protein